MNVYDQHYINGRWVDSIGGKAHHVVKPATEEPSTKITFGSRADVDAAVMAAKNALKTFRNTSREETLPPMRTEIRYYDMA